MYRYWLLMLLVTSIRTAAGSVPSDDFEVNLKTAIETGSTEEGATYDRALAAYFFGLPGFTSQVVQCVEKTSASESVRGYFYFDAQDGYRLFVKPENGFSNCLTTVFNDRSPPSPPKRPYFNPFNLGVDPGI